MQTTLTQSLLQTRSGREADDILRNCVHCGFCNATCPTYQLTGDELDGPRGRIYLIKQVLEGSTPTHRTRLHLDRCLTCRACETTCPSGVDYHRLLDTGRELVERHVPRNTAQRLLRLLLRKVLPYPGRFGPLLRTGQLLRPLLPGQLKKRVPARRKPGPRARPARPSTRRVLLPEGCVQPVLAPQINQAVRRVLAALGIEVFTTGNGGCCGALSHHLGAPGEARKFMRANIDAWWPAIEDGAEAIVITATGCAPMVKDYARLLADDPDYAGKAARVSELARDLSEILAAERPQRVVTRAGGYRKIAFHSPCTLQHAQQLGGTVERLLTGLGYELLPVADAHLCCGSAGTYSILQPELAGRLRDAKLAALQADGPELIATANIGCLLHLAGNADVPVVHWIELLETPTTETRS
ncbi:MAG: glycolate oxidase subunit GlcF [Gammaproteobacteria bacterium]|jgi:glycolate oxidase iron-sulfur subunit